MTVASNLAADDLLVRRLSMPSENSELLELLKSELSFVEQGGYGRSVRTPWKSTTVFRDSPSCLNFNDAERPHPCSDCALMQFVPAEQRETDMPCHHIILSSEGQTVDSFERCGTQQELENGVATWLRTAIARIEQEQNAAHAHASTLRYGSDGEQTPEVGERP
jgi:hypothetical protein